MNRGRCNVCDHNCRFVAPDGPSPCEVMFIGEKPGQQEDRGGRPFIGDSGREFNQNYLSLAGLSREDIRITNTVKCRLGGNNNKPTPEQIRTCASHHLPREIADSAPSVCVLMGATACSLVPDIELEKEHGIPRWIESTQSEILNWDGWIVPMFHPASGLHDTGMMIPLLEDFERLGLWLKNRWTPPSRSYDPDYKIATRDDLDTLTDASLVGLDTEDDCGKPWSVQYSIRPGMGRLVFTHDGEGIDALRRLLPGKEIVMHNAPHDLGVLEQIGINVTQWRDTMQEAYHLGNLPQGLKPLAYRLLGIRMRSWEDVVGPPSRLKMIEWLTERWMECEPEITTKQLKTKVKTIRKPSQIERDLKRILSHSHKSSYDLWEQADKLCFNLTEKDVSYPRKSISHVQTIDAVDYACQDADVTLQVALILSQMREELVRGEWFVDEEDYDQ